MANRYTKKHVHYHSQSEECKSNNEIAHYTCEAALYIKIAKTDVGKDVEIKFVH